MGERDVPLGQACGGGDEAAEQRARVGLAARHHGEQVQAAVGEALARQRMENQLLAEGVRRRESAWGSSVHTAVGMSRQAVARSARLRGCGSAHALTKSSVGCAP